MAIFDIGKDVLHHEFHFNKSIAKKYKNINMRLKQLVWIILVRIRELENRCEDGGHFSYDIWHAFPPVPSFLSNQIIIINVKIFFTNLSTPLLPPSFSHLPNTLQRERKHRLLAKQKRKISTTFFNSLMMMVAIWTATIRIMQEKASKHGTETRKWHYIILFR